MTPRSLLALAALTWLVAPGPVVADEAAGAGAGATTSAGVASAAAAAAPVAPPSKKDAYLASKRAATRPARRGARPRVGKPPAPVISVFNTWTHEWLVIERDDRAPLPPAEQVDRFLRCHFTNQATDMRKELIATLRDAGRHFAARRIDIVSGYRSPKYNLMLRKKGHEVAKDSQHTQGHAVDFRIPGVDVRDLESWAVGRRKGGVGLYLESKFIHVDVGPFRRWNGS